MKHSMFLILAAFYFLTACSTTPQAMRSKSPNMVHTSEKEPRTIALCIADQWENTRLLGGNPIVNLREIHNGYSVSMHYGKKLHYLVDIEDRENGSTTKMYRYMVAAPFGDPTLDVVASCQL